MRLLSVNGNMVSKSVSRFAIKWDGTSKSKLQFRVKQFLKPFWAGHIVYEEFPVYGSKLHVDIFNATLRTVIEVQGPQHTQFHYFHGGKPFDYLAGIKRDDKKVVWAELNGLHFIEINFDQVDSLSQEFFRENFQLTL